MDQPRIPGRSLGRAWPSRRVQGARHRQGAFRAPFAPSTGGGAGGTAGGTPGGDGEPGPGAAAGHSRRHRLARGLPALALVAVLLLVAAARAGAASPAPASLEDLLVPDRYFIVTADEMVGRGASVMPVTEPGAGPFEVIVRFESAEIHNLALTQDLSQGSPLYLQITSSGVARVTDTAMRTDLLSLIGTIPGAAQAADPIQFVLDLLESGGQVTLRVRDMGMRATWMHTGTAVLPGAVMRFVTDPADLAQRDRIQRVERQAAMLHGKYRDLDDLRRDRQQQERAGLLPGLPGGDLPLPGLPGPGLPSAPLPDLPLPKPRIPAPPVPPLPLPEEARDLVACLEEALPKDPLSLLDLSALRQGDLEGAVAPLRDLNPQAVAGCLADEPAPEAPETPAAAPAEPGESGADQPALPLPVQPALPDLSPALACVAGSLDLAERDLEPLAGDSSLTATELLDGLVDLGLAEARSVPSVALQLAGDCGRYWPDLADLAGSLLGGTGSSGEGSDPATGTTGDTGAAGTGDGAGDGSGEGGLLPLLGGLLSSAGLGGLLRKGP